MILSTVALLVIFAAFFILFSEELFLTFKKFCSNSNIMLVTSLFAASLFFLIFEYRIDIFLAELRFILYSTLYSLGMYPKHFWLFLVGKILILSFIAFTWIVIGKVLPKISIIKNISKNSNKLFIDSVAYIWLLFCMVLIVNI